MWSNLTEDQLKQVAQWISWAEKHATRKRLLCQYENNSLDRITACNAWDSAMRHMHQTEAEIRTLVEQRRLHPEMKPVAPSNFPFIR
jgi:hypothetical protein